MMNRINLKDIGAFGKFIAQGNKISLSIREGNRREGAGPRFIETWQLGADMGFAYWAYFGDQRNFTQVGQQCLGFIKISANRFLFVTAGEITRLGSVDAACDFVELPAYSPYVGRLVVSFRQDPEAAMGYGRNVFNAETYFEHAEVEEILPRGFDTRNLAKD